jgi:nonsense-mediated mRNA decay protein 3
MCPKCGNDADSFIEGICKECYLADHSLIKGFKDFVIFFCGCNKFKTKDKSKWMLCKNLNDAVNKSVTKNLVPELGVTIEEIKTELVLPKHVPNAGVKVVGEIEITVNGFFSEDLEEPVFESTIIPVKVNFTICKDCSRPHSQYFEGILQLRNADPEIETFVKKAVDKNRLVFITKEKKTTNGVDYYLTSNQFAHSMGHELRNKFGGIIKENSKLFSRDSTTSKEQRRLTVLYKPHPFKLHDAVSYDKKVYTINKMGKEVLGKNVVTGKTTLLRLEKEMPERLETVQTTIAITSPRIEVIHPKTFQSTPVENKETTLKPGDEIQIVELNNRFFII